MDGDQFRAVGECRLDLHGMDHLGHARHALAALEAHSTSAQQQVDLFAAPPASAAPEPSAVDAAVAQMDPDTLSPREALEWVYRLKKLAGS